MMSPQFVVYVDENGNLLGVPLIYCLSCARHASGDFMAEFSPVQFRNAHGTCAVCLNTWEV